jgi:VCBS repeat-containing protein
LTLTAGETFSNESSLCPSLSIVLDANASVPPFTGNTQSVTIPGHFLQIGSIGNTNCFLYESTQQCSIVAGTAPCYRVFPDNTFSGGQDAYTGPVVQQSDIDGAVSGMAQPDPLQVLQPQIKPNEHLVGTPHCTPQVTSDHKAGDKGAQVTVRVTFTCAGEVYDQGAAVAMVATLLTQQAATDPGAGYALVGQLKTTITAGAADAQNTVALTLSAQGVWAYQVSAAQQQALAHRIAGKSVHEAQQVLSTQPGVAQAAIDLSGGGQTLPSDPANIKMVVRGVI